MIKKANLSKDLKVLQKLNKIISPDETIERLKNDFSKSNGEVYIKYHDEKPVGFTSFVYPLWNNIAVILHLSVDETLRGKGFGTELLEFSKSRATEVGARFISVDTATWNEKAIKLYEKVGFIRRAIFPNYFGAGNEMLWLDCDLRKSEND